MLAFLGRFSHIFHCWQRKWSFFFITRILTLLPDRMVKLSKEGLSKISNSERRKVSDWFTYFVFLSIVKFNIGLTKLWLSKRNLNRSLFSFYFFTGKNFWRQSILSGCINDFFVHCPIPDGYFDCYFRFLILLVRHWISIFLQSKHLLFFKI